MKKEVFKTPRMILTICIAIFDIVWFAFNVAHYLPMDIAYDKVEATISNVETYNEVGIFEENLYTYSYQYRGAQCEWTTDIIDLSATSCGAKCMLYINPNNPEEIELFKLVDVTVNLINIIILAPFLSLVYRLERENIEAEAKSRGETI